MQACSSLKIKMNYFCNLWKCIIVVIHTCQKLLVSLEKKLTDMNTICIEECLIVFDCSVSNLILNCHLNIKIWCYSATDYLSIKMQNPLNIQILSKYTYSFFENSRRDRVKYNILIYCQLLHVIVYKCAGVCCGCSCGGQRTPSLVIPQVQSICETWSFTRLELSSSLAWNC